ncbi:MAG TPA: hypothetical protein VK815_06580 [Candidatus Acidoferrales bacterium]|nr:hypothetical protein [Candidatus Acidoferrales bacterium]
MSFILAGFGWLQYLVDDGMGTGWAHNVVRNWQQFGFFNLHGRLVINSGGFEALSNPVIYKGMSPVSLYPAFFATQIFGWTGLGTLSFQILLALAAFWAVWDLLGRNLFAWLTAAAVILSPGYFRWLNILDPNVITVIFGLPYIAIVITILKRPQAGPVNIAGLLLLTLAFISLNWTTAWVLGPCSLLLLGLPQIKRRAAFLFIALVGAGSVLFVVFSVLVKAGHSQGGGGGFLQFLRGYTWGDVGYGAGLTTARAFTRIAFTSLVALLPVFLLAGWVVLKYFRRGEARSWFALSPFGLTLVEVAFMRNYFGHHPWMAAPLLIVGMVFSLILLRSRPENSGAAPATHAPRMWLPVVLLVCFIYGLMVVEFFRANGPEGRVLQQLVRQHTQRQECIVIIKSLDPETALIAGRLGEPFDRRTLVVDDLDHLPADISGMVVLTARPAENALHLRAQTAASRAPMEQWLAKGADWFNHNIARRQPGDRVEVAGTYFLYDLKP